MSEEADKNFSAGDIPTTSVSSDVTKCETSKIIYEPLDAHTVTIRLLRLSSGEPGSPLHGTLELANLNDTPQYHALSYTWADDRGDASLREQIFIGQEWIAFPITPNCSAALRNLRKADEHILFWVDSVCINQAAGDERSHQVGLMGRIYSLAHSVLIYIGEDAYRGKRTGERTVSAINMCLLDSWRPNSLSAKLADFKGFFGRAYFTRLWIIQEIALAREAFVVCGSRRLNWALFNIKRLEVMDTGMNRWLPSWTKHILGGPRDRSFEEFADLLVATSACQASDARDKVFGLLGLSTEARKLGLIADYSLSLHQTYIGTAALLIQNGLVDIVFRAAAVSNRALEFCSIPSWVPLWSHSTLTSPRSAFQQLERISTFRYPHRRSTSDTVGFVDSEEHLDTDFLPKIRQLGPDNLWLHTENNSCEHLLVNYETGALIVKGFVVAAPGSFDRLGSPQQAPALTGKLMSSLGTGRRLLAFAGDHHLLSGDSVIAVQGCHSFLHVREDLSGRAPESQVRQYQLLGPCILAVLPQLRRGISSTPYYFASPQHVQVLIRWESVFGYGASVDVNGKVAVERFLRQANPWSNTSKARGNALDEAGREILQLRVEFWNTVLVKGISQLLAGGKVSDGLFDLFEKLEHHVDLLEECFSVMLPIHDSMARGDDQDTTLFRGGEECKVDPRVRLERTKGEAEATIHKIRDIIQTDLAIIEPLEGLRLDESGFERRRPGEKYRIRIDLLDTLDEIEANPMLAMLDTDLIQGRMRQEPAHPVLQDKQGNPARLLRCSQLGDLCNLMKYTMAELPELREMCDGMALLHCLLPGPREPREAIFV